MLSLVGLFFVCLQLSSLESTIVNDHDTVIPGIGTSFTSRRSSNAVIQSSKLVKDIFNSLKANVSKLDHITPVKYKNEKFITSEYAGQCSILNGGSPVTYSMQKEAMIGLEAFYKLMQSSDYDRKSEYEIPEEYCAYRKEYDVKCDYYNPWRTFDGTCNNVKHPKWGAVHEPFQRLVAPAYDDGYNAPRTHAVDGSNLPNARKIAMYVHAPYPTKSDWSHMLVWFSQFVTHDVTKIASIVHYDGNQKWCKCGTYDPDCFNIPIPYEDYWNKDQKCFSFIRSAPSSYECNLGPREQTNLVSSFVDLSQVYGSNKDVSRHIREYKYGLLKTSYNKYSNREQLPYKKGIKSCIGLEPRHKCSMAGDGRHEDNGFLNSLHTIFVREHNRVARKLAYWNPYWDDEMTFQEARRVVIAEYQFIIYGELLPLLFGERVMKKFDLSVNYDGYFMGYDPEEIATTYNEFGAAAARFGHTLIKNFQVRADNYYKQFNNRSVDYYIFNQELPEYGGGIESLALGALSDWSYYPTPQVNDILNNWLAADLFYEETGNYRFSLPALNIQRGRDHGIASYASYREFCGLGLPYSFEDLTNIPKDVIYRLKKVYKNVEDIDLWTGMVSEYPLEGGLVGATQACVLAKGFSDWKRGDRWWFENGNEEYIRFTPEQLKEIRSTSFARIICDNLDVDYVQELAFLWPNKEYNPWVKCKNIKGIDFGKWKDIKNKYSSY